MTSNVLMGMVNPTTHSLSERKITDHCL